MKTAILAILLFCIMIFPHELGHFIAARRVGIKVNEFAFGMGPTIWKRQGKETLYSIRLFPIGGFCAMEGEDGSEEQEEEGNGRADGAAYNSAAAGTDGDGRQALRKTEMDPRSFAAKKPWQKIVVLAAGSVMNILCAILIMSVVLGISGFTTNRIGTVNAGSPAEAAGLAAGDEITFIDGNPVKSWEDVTTYMPEDGAAIELTVEGKDGSRSVQVQPELQEIKDENGKVTGTRYVIGITSKITHNPAKAVIYGTKSTWNLVKLMFQSIGMLISGEAGTEDLSGPVGMVQMVNQTETLGYWYYAFLVSLICVNLAIINMLPLPALDGGRILFVLFTVITGKRVSSRVEGTVHLIGMALLFTLMIYVTFNDVTRIFG